MLGNMNVSDPYNHRGRAFRSDQPEQDSVEFVLPEPELLDRAVEGVLEHKRRLGWKLLSSQGGRVELSEDGRFRAEESVTSFGAKAPLT
jgi:hypothetical protein